MDKDDKKGIGPARPWRDLENILSGEAGASFARAIEEAFPIEPVKSGSSSSPLTIDETFHAETRRARS